MNPLVVSESDLDVASVVTLLTAALRRRGVALQATFDHAAGARRAGSALPDEVVLVFGDPAVGTGLMQADPRVGIELPLRVLVWTEAGRTRIGYRDPRRLVDGYDVAARSDVLDRLRGLLDQLVAEVPAAQQITG